MSQSNTRVGDFQVLAGEALTGMEGRLVVITHDSGTPEVKLPAAITDYALYAVIEGAADAGTAAVRPIEAGRNVRLRLEGTCNPGDVLVLADQHDTGIPFGDLNTFDDTFAITLIGGEQ